MSWELVHPSPEHEMSLQTGQWEEAVLGPQRHGRALRHPELPPMAVPQLTLTTDVDVGELVLFRRDLRSTLDAVVVCAVGRALGAHPYVNVTVTERTGGPTVVPAAWSAVRLLVLCDDGLRGGVVDADGSRPLTEIRDAVTELVHEIRTGRTVTSSPQAAVSLTTFALSGGAASGAVASPASAALTVGRLAEEARAMRIGLSVDARVVDAEQASGFLSTLVRLLEHPYRRLR